MNKPHRFIGKNLKRHHAALLRIGMDAFIVSCLCAGVAIIGLIVSELWLKMP
jgi:hypothetical protein